MYKFISELLLFSFRKQYLNLELVADFNVKVGVKRVTVVSKTVFILAVQLLR